MKMQINNGPPLADDALRPSLRSHPYKVHQSEVPSVPSTSFVPLSTDDPGGSSNRRVFQQSVTLNAFMEGYPRTTDRPFADTGWFLLGVTQAQLPIVVGSAAGGLVLILTLLGLVVWRFCQRQRSKEKQYCLKDTEEERQRRRHSLNLNATKRTSNDSVIYINTAKASTSKHPSHHHSHHHHHHHHHHHSQHHHNGRQQQQHHHRQLSDNNATTASSDRSEAESSKTPSISRSQSAPLKEKDATAIASTKKRPQSQPIHCGRSVEINGTSPHLCYLTDVRCASDVEGQLPDIPEIRLQSTETLDSEPQSCTYSTYDHPMTKRRLQLDSTSATLKTRSLPTWVRSRPRPLSTEDDVNELYAKVNFNKKRKNRMRNDSAAAIALNKSRSQFIHFPFMHKDTDSLVDNEAIVIFDERTAL